MPRHAARLGIALAATSAACGQGSSVVPVPEGPLQAEVVSITEPGSTLEGQLRLQIVNRSPLPVFIAIDLRAAPGFWLRPTVQEVRAVRIEADTSIILPVPFRFSKLSPAAELRLRVGPAEQRREGIFAPEPVLTRRWHFGNHPAAQAFIARFDTLRAGGLTLYALKGSLAAGRLPEMAQTRGAAAESIAALLGVAIPPGIQIVFYPDSATKTTDTRHIGAGWASGLFLVEIYNDSLQLDPFHELTHILAGLLGSPRAWLDEGFATWSSERLGGDALAELGGRGVPVDVAACRYLRAGRAIPWDSLMGASEFMQAGLPGDVAYAQSASIVGYLIRRFGQETFRRLYRQESEVGLQRSLNEPLATTEATWREQVLTRCPE